MQELLDKCCGIDVHKESLTAVRPDKPHTFRRKKKNLLKKELATS